MSNFQRNLAFGKIGESLIANWLKRRGYTVLPVYEKEISKGKGPQLFTPNENLIAPDLFAFNGIKDRAFWIEAKHKSAFTWHRISRQWLTGINLRHYYDYLKVARESPWPVWLLFLHQDGQAKDSPPGCPTGLFGQELGYLQQHEHHRWNEGGMVYWADTILEKLATLEEVYAPAPPALIYGQLRLLRE